MQSDEEAPLIGSLNEGTIESRWKSAAHQRDDGVTSYWSGAKEAPPPLSRLSIWRLLPACLRGFTIREQLIFFVSPVVCCFLLICFALLFMYMPRLAVNVKNVEGPGLTLIIRRPDSNDVTYYDLIDLYLNGTTAAGPALANSTIVDEWMAAVAELEIWDIQHPNRSADDVPPIVGTLLLRIQAEISAYNPCFASFIARNASGVAMVGPNQIGVLNNSGNVRIPARTQLIQEISGNFSITKTSTIVYIMSGLYNQAGVQIDIRITAHWTYIFFKYHNDLEIPVFLDLNGFLQQRVPGSSNLPIPSIPPAADGRRRQPQRPPGAPVGG